MRIIEDEKLDFSDVLIVPKRSSLVSRKEVDLNKQYKFKHSSVDYSGVPVIASNMDQTGTMEMAKALSEFEVSVALHKHYTVDELVEYYKKEDRGNTFYTMGITDADFEKFVKVYERLDGRLNKISVDVANGYTETFLRHISELRSMFPDILIMAGTVVTGDITEQIIQSGADIVRIGIGSGSVCITRKVAGVGYPQLSAVIECADAAHGLKGHVVSDGGCTTPGDVAKAFGAGADFVMLGGMFAGHDECNGEKVYDLGEPVVTVDGIMSHTIYPDKKITHMKFYGMSSSAAMEKYSGGVADYRASEGKEVLIPYRGPVANTIKEILGGVRSACTYTGSETLKQLPKRTTFIKVHRTHNTVFGDE
jgi:GMP reductase